MFFAVPHPARDELGAYVAAAAGNEHLLPPDLPHSTQGSAWSWASLMAHSAQPIRILYHLMCAGPQPGTNKVLPVQGWGGVGLGRLPTGAEAASLCLFSAPSTVLKPITMPDIQITEVDAPAESDQMSSPTGRYPPVGGASSWGPAM